MVSGAVPRPDRQRRLPGHRLPHLRLARPAQRRRSRAARRTSAATCSPTAASSSTANWSVTGSLRYATDRTFLRRYDISRDDRLRSMVNVERIDDRQLPVDRRLGDPGDCWSPTPQGLVPIALPVIDYRRRLADPLLGGQIELQANTLAITRTSGQDTQRAFARAQWNLRRITALGQEVTAHRAGARRRLSFGREPARP